MRKMKRMAAFLLAVVLSVLTPAGVLADVTEIFETADSSQGEEVCAEVTEVTEELMDAATASEVPEVAEEAEELLSAGVAVTMDKASPAVGSAITVTKPGTSTLKWFVYAQGAERGNAVSTESTYTPSSADRNKWIEVQAYEPSGTFAGSDRLFFSEDPVCYLTLADGSTEVYDLYIGNQYDNTAEIEEIKDSRTSGSSMPKVYRLELSTAAALFGMNNASYYVLIPAALYKQLPTLYTTVPGGEPQPLMIIGQEVVLSLRNSFVEDYVLCEYAAVGWFGGDAVYPSYPANPTFEAVTKYFMFNTLFEKIYSPGYYWTGLNGEKVYVNFNGNGRSTAEYVRQWAAYPYFIVKSAEVYWDQRDEIGTSLTSGSPTLFYGYGYPYVVPDYAALRLRLTALDTMFRTEDDAITNCGLMTGGLDYRQSGKLSVESNMRPDNETDADRAPADGLLPKDTALVLDVTVSDSSVKEAGVYVNGNLYTEECGDGTYDVVNGKFRVVVKPAFLTAAIGSKNIVSFVSYGNDGSVMKDGQNRVITDYLSVIRSETVTAGSYTVSFDTNGGSEITSQIVEEGESAKEPKAPVKNGHTFAGWYADKDLSVPFGFETAVTEDITVYARWYKNDDIDGKVFTVTFDTNKGLPMNPQKVNGGELLLKPEDPVKNGYIFLGWYRDAELMALYDFSIPVTEDLTIYARWKKDPAVADKEYEVTFDSNGGSPVASQTVPGAEYVKVPEEPVKNGHIFDGWYKDAARKESYDFTIPVTEAHTVYARWKKDPAIASQVFTFTFDSMGGLPVEDVKVNGCDYVSELPVPVKNGHIFDAWCNEETLETVYDTSVPVAENHKLYAKWHKDPAVADKIFTVKFEMDGGNPVPEQKVKGADLITVPETPVKEGYNFVRWYAESTLSTPFDFTIPVTEDKTVYARWELRPDAVKYEVSFNLGNGVPPLGKQYVTTGTKVNRPSDIVRDNGYHIENWYLEKEYKNVYDFDTPVYAPLVLFAKWVRLPGAPAGSGSGGGGGSAGVSSTTTGGTVKVSADPDVPAWVVTEGEWIGSGNGLWMYKYKNAIVANKWMALLNPYANTNAGQRKYDWFRFDANGAMMTGWFTDTDGNVYYLQETSDGSRGRMVTGWQTIGGKEYYFSNEEGSGTMGALLRNTTTPDGHQVNARGEKIR